MYMITAFFIAALILLVANVAIDVMNGKPEEYIEDEINEYIEYVLPAFIGLIVFVVIVSHNSNI